MNFTLISDFTYTINELLKKQNRKLSRSCIYVNVYDCDIFFTSHAFSRLEKRFSDYYFDWVFSGIVKSTNALKKFRKTGKRAKGIYTNNSKRNTDFWISRYRMIRHVFTIEYNIPFDILLYDFEKNNFIEVIDTSEKYILKTLYFDSYAK